MPVTQKIEAAAEQSLSVVFQLLLNDVVVASQPATEYSNNLGTYHSDFSDLVANTYDLNVLLASNNRVMASWKVKVELQDGTYLAVDQIPGSVETNNPVVYVNMTDYYTTRHLIENEFGADNVTQWADLDNNRDNVSISARVDQVIVNVCDLFDDRMRNHVIDLPLTPPYPRTIERICTYQAGIELYASRGLEDNNRLSWHQKQSDMLIKRILGGQLDLSVIESEGRPSVQ